MPSAADEVRARLRAQIAAIESGDAGDHSARSESDRVFPQEDAVQDAARQASASPSAGCRTGSNTARRNTAQAAARHEAARPDDEEDRAFRKVERLACAREQASEALRRRLAREGFSDEASSAAVERAVSCGLVDDRRYADVLVRSRLSQGRGKSGIAAELAGLGIDPGEVESFAEAGADEGGEIERALALLDRKPPRAKNRRDAAFRRLVQKGFGSAIASSAARLWCERNPDRTDGADGSTHESTDGADG